MEGAVVFRKSYLVKLIENRLNMPTKQQTDALAAPVA